MDAIDIQYHLKKRGIPQKQLALELGVGDMAVSNVINKRIVSDRIMKAVAKAIGRDVIEVFPEYYLKPPKRKTSQAFGAAGK